MRYQIALVPFMGSINVTVRAYREAIGGLPDSVHYYVMTQEDGETDRLHSVLSWLGGEVAADTP